MPTQSFDFSSITEITHNGAPVEKLDLKVSNAVTKTFTVKVKNSSDGTPSWGSGQVFVLDDDWWPPSQNGTISSGFNDVWAPGAHSSNNAGFGNTVLQLALRAGYTYEFDQSDSSNSGHPIGFTANSSNAAGGSSAGLVTSGTVSGCTISATGTAGSAGAKTTISVPANQQSTNIIYFGCTFHQNMGGSITTAPDAAVEVWRRVFLNDEVTTQTWVPPTYGWVSVPTGNTTNPGTYYWYVSCNPQPADVWGGANPFSSCPTGYSGSCSWSNVGQCPWTCSLTCTEYTQVWGETAAGYWDTQTTDNSRYIYFY